MKAITCSQCGALVKEIPVNDKFTFCAYCGAKLRLEEKTVIELREPKRELKNIVGKDRERVFENTLRQNNDSQSYNDAKAVLTTFFVIGAVALFIILPFMLKSFFNFKPERETFYETNVKTFEQSPTAFPIYETIEPPVNISYRAYVQYDSNIGADHVEIPTIELEQLPTNDIKELKKTVFATRRIRVKIKIDENGEVLEAKALNGHQVLQESSVRAAKKSLFSNRRKPATTTLSYIYILE